MKMIKLSLAAAVVAASFTTASATSLEEAVKNIDVSGYARIRYNQAENTGSADEYKVGTTLTNGTVTVGLWSTTTSESTTQASQGYTGNTVSLTDLYFTENIAGVQVKAGIQNYSLPMTDDEDGSGVKLTTKMGGFTVVAAAFDDSVNALAAMGNLGQFSVAAVGAKIGETDYTYVSAATEVNGISIDAARATAEATGDDYVVSQINASTNVAGYTLSAGFAQVENNGAVAMLDAGDTAADFGVEAVNTADADANANAFYVGVSKAVAGYTLSATYANMDSDDNTEDQSEVLYQVKTKLAGNTAITAWYSDSDVDGNDTARVEVKYSF